VIRRRRSSDEQVLRDLLEHLNAGAPALSDKALAAAARRATTEPRQPQQRRVPEDSRPWRPLQLRWTVGGAAAILLATGLGFGVGAWLTPSGSARPVPRGLGFLPAKGWTVMQSGSASSTEEARALAANVPFAPGDRAGADPLATLRTLPPAGVVVVATLNTRGNARTDAGFPLRSLPLQLSGATRRSSDHYVLRAGVGGYNVDARIYFGSAPPTPSALQAAERQVERLVVAPDPVSIAVRPTIASARQPVTVYGSVASGKAGEKVTIQFKRCGLYPILFRDVAEVTTSEGGGFSAELGADTNGPFRAVAGDAVSNQVPVQSRPDVRLSPRPPGRYEVDVVDFLSYWRKRVLLQRFDRRSRTWLNVRTLVLDNQFGPSLIWSTTDKFRVKLPKGTTIRAVLPLDQAKPCHIGGYSNLLRT
jgi:hypothetical protein